MQQDPESARTVLTSSLVKDAVREVRMGFVRKVYSILAAQLLLTCVVAAPITTVDTRWLQNHVWLLYMSVAVTLVTICAMSCCRGVAQKYPLNYVLLFTFTGFEGVMVGFVSAAYTWQSVVLAAGITCAIFLLMTLYAWKTKTDFTGFGPYLFAALVSLCIFGFVISLLAMFGAAISWAIMLYDACGVLLFTFYIVFDTQLLIGEYGGHKVQFGIDDYVFAALNLYLDIINLFLHILRLFGERR
jgi:FtsH-binding integral membrane protein